MNGYWHAQLPKQPATPGHHPIVAPPPRNADEAIQLEEEEYAASKEEFNERIKEELDRKDIQQTLSRANYKRKFHNLVCWEEKTHIEILEKK